MKRMFNLLICVFVLLSCYSVQDKILRTAEHYVRDIVIFPDIAGVNKIKEFKISKIFIKDTLEDVRPFLSKYKNHKKMDKYQKIVEGTPVAGYVVYISYEFKWGERYHFFNCHIVVSSDLKETSYYEADSSPFGNTPKFETLFYQDKLN